MIEKFYGHILTPDIMLSIRKAAEKDSRSKGEKAYPFGAARYKGNGFFRLLLV